jgi:rfaE bifunctional protein nucleotidyltransferase chain/domain
MENNKVLVFVNGTFDVLHRGHIELLNYAKSIGNHLVVGVDTDERIKEKKGKLRPVNSLKERTFMLENLKAVDEVFSFSSNQELETLIKYLKPGIMVVGSDWRDKPVIGSQYASKLIFFERINGYSTTKIIQSIIDRR